MTAGTYCDTDILGSLADCLVILTNAISSVRNDYDVSSGT